MIIKKFFLIFIIYFNLFSSDKILVSNFTQTDRLLEYDDTCSICRDDFDSKKPVTVMHCRHRFHLACISNWILSDGDKCPNCRDLVDSETLDSFFQKMDNFEDSFQKELRIKQKEALRSGIFVTSAVFLFLFLLASSNYY